MIIGNQLITGKYTENEQLSNSDFKTTKDDNVCRFLCQDICKINEEKREK